MKIAVITDMARFQNSMSFDMLKSGMERLGFTMDLLFVENPASIFSQKIPLIRFCEASSLLTRLSRYDLLHVHLTFPLGFFYAFFKAVHGKPVLVHTHGYDVFSVPSVGYGLTRNKIGKSLARYTWTNASHVIVTCRKAKENLVRAGVSSERTTVVYNGVDVDFFKKRKVEDETLVKIRKNCNLVFLNVAGLTPVKNHEDLLVAFSYFVRRHKEGRGSKLVICGDGPLKGRLLQLTHKLRITENVVFLGQQPHSKMPEIYSIADVFVLPSLSEAHPWSLLEAMSCELPSIASAVGGIPETIQDDNLILKPPQAEACYSSRLFEKMVFLAHDEKRRSEIGARNREIVVKGFRMEHHIRKLNALYTQLLFGNGTD